MNNVTTLYLDDVHYVSLPDKTLPMIEFLCLNKTEKGLRKNILPTEAQLTNISLNENTEPADQAEDPMEGRLNMEEGELEESTVERDNTSLSKQTTRPKRQLGSSFGTNILRGKAAKRMRKIASKVLTPALRARRRKYNSNATRIRELHRELHDTPITTLNPEQKQVVYRIAVKGEPLVNVNAPAGTGKTRLIAAFTRFMIQKYPLEVILCVAQGNGAVRNMATAILRDRQARMDTSRDDILLIESRHATQREQHQGYVWRQHRPFGEEDLSDLRVEAVLQQVQAGVQAGTFDLDSILDERDSLRPTNILEAIDTYLHNKKTDPRLHMDESKYISYAFALTGRRIIIATIDKMMGMLEIFRDCKVLIVDEAGQARHVDIGLLTTGLDMDHLLMVGDHQQIEPYSPPEMAKCLNPVRTSVAAHFQQRCDFMNASLVTSYRGHPSITAAVSAAFYGGNLRAGVLAASRTIVTSKFHLMTSQYPIMLFHTDATPTTLTNRSKCNTKQCDFALKLIRRLSQSVTGTPTLCINCYYKGDRAYMTELLTRTGSRWNWPTREAKQAELSKFEWVQVRTVHSYIGEEADIHIVITSQNAAPNLTRDENIQAPFTHTNRIANVSLTRARHGLFVIGDMNFLSDAEVAPHSSMRKFITFVGQQTPAVDVDRYSDYMHANPATNPPQYAGNLLIDPTRHEPMYANIFFNSNYNQPPGGAAPPPPPPPPIPPLPFTPAPIDDWAAESES